MKVIVVVALALIAPLAFAASKGAKEQYNEAVKAETADQFAAVVADVRSEMREGGRYEFVQAPERAEVDRNLASMERLFGANGGLVANMSQDDKVALFNAQESVNAILTRRDADRVICENRKPIGSNIPKTTCHTYRQQEEARRGTNKAMNDWGGRGCIGGTKDRPCMPGSGGGGR